MIKRFINIIRIKMFKHAFTLLELLIVIALIVIIASVVIVLSKPLDQIAKANDTKRKNDLDVLYKAFEEFYNDHGCYPKPEEVCYDNPTNICTISKTATSKICNICGGKENAPSSFSNFSPYLKGLPCDPEHPKKKYLYEVQVTCTRSNDGCASSQCLPNYCPSWYRIYSDFSSVYDKASYDLGCIAEGCGPTMYPIQTTPPFGYDYGKSSPNVSLQSTTQYHCYTNSHTCDDCSTCNPSDPKCTTNLYQNCLNNTSCIDKNKIYSSFLDCCLSNGIGNCH
jgi:prepilin-type N-terminal cleavage/methylation domain-containing protein